MPDDFICARCARMGKTCCQETRVFLTLGDVRRISEAVGEDDFHEYAVPESGTTKQSAALDPLWTRTFAHPAGRRVLRHDARGACRFLGKKGCRLPLDVRPLVCRLYPFDYNAETIKGVYGHLCPEPESANPAFLLAMLGMNRARASEWREQLYREITEEFPEP